VAARPLLERALTITEAAHGPEHPTVAVSLNNLAQGAHDDVAAVLAPVRRPAMRAARLGGHRGPGLFGDQRLLHGGEQVVGLGQPGCHPLAG